MITYVAQIGNSDNRLPQEMWSNFIDCFGTLLADLGVQIHFFGFSNPAARWQNCCAVFEDPRRRPDREFQQDLETRLAKLAFAFDQDSIALQYGHTGFIKAAS